MASLISLILASLIPIAWGRNESLWMIGTGDYEASRTGFDYFILALQWPGSICQNSLDHCCETNACCHGFSGPVHFTIHGLWPDYNDGSWPQCCSGSSFDEKKIVSLLGALEEDWPSLSCSSPTSCHGGRVSFWAHEWEKHGTCAYPVIRDEYNYFSTTLQLYSKYNILDFLKAAGYNPRNSEEYLARDLVAAISRGVGATPSLVCSNGQLKELRLCFHKDFKPLDCTTGYAEQSDLGWQTSCPQYILLPQYVSSGGGATKVLRITTLIISVTLGYWRPFI